ncbi:helix-turn-helix domain-containing protein [Mobiluncus porci]|uniref:HTH cro/C1-type domain-containing protein n=1 Tax=Mobiluncus porci TaxID=2652278 RepID=A0A7K0K1X8_9ACTO|nr:hypothetical protein [Mobiluncus porci]MST49483.1 hypothetical protein [Mobiluncus porci]
MKTPSIDTEISEAVRKLKRKKGLTSIQIAKALNLTRSSFNDRLMNRTPWRLTDVDALARLGVEVPPLGGVEC